MRILGIDPNGRGLSYAVLESQGNLVEWGIKRVHRLKTDVAPVRMRQDRTLEILGRLIDTFRPDVIVFESWDGANSRRWLDTRMLLHRISQLVANRHLASHTYTLASLFGILAEYDIKTKYDMAVFFGRLYPELESRVPHKRRPWDSESPSLSLFKAVAMAFVRSEKLP